MICKNCGREVNGPFCTSCGTPVDTNTPNMNATTTPVAPTPVMNQVPQTPVMNQVNPNMGNQMPQYNQPMYTTPYTAPKKNNTGLIIAIVVVAVVLLGIVGISMASHGDDSEVTTNESGEKVSEGVSITVDGYTYKVPSRYTAKESNGRLQLTSKDNVDLALIDIVDGDFNNIRNNQTYIKNYLTTSGYTVLNIGNRVVGGMDFVTIEVSQNGQKMLMGYAKFNSSKVFLVTVGNTSYTIDYDLLADVVPIMRSAQS